MSETLAAQDGCYVRMLFVKDSNTGAIALYRKCGYRDFRLEGYGRFMLKELHTTFIGT